MELRWLAGTCPPTEGINEERRQSSDGLNSCPAVLKDGDDAVLVGYPVVDEATRQRLGIPEGETAIRTPGWVLLQGADAYRSLESG